VTTQGADNTEGLLGSKIGFSGNKISFMNSASGKKSIKLSTYFDKNDDKIKEEVPL
jgi:hypothetical protein